MAYHDHSGPGMRAKLLAALDAGQSIAYASEAGMPMIADPGYDLGRAAQEAGHLVTSAPGPTALPTALTLGGLATDTVLFEGFLPSGSSQRRSRIEGLKDVPATLAIYESPKRIAASLVDLAAILGSNREAALCRELTKKFEEIRRGTLEGLITSVQQHQPKGEIVLLVARGTSEKISEDEIDTQLRQALKTLSVRDAADLVSGATGLKRRTVYQRALQLDQKG